MPDYMHINQNFPEAIKPFLSSEVLEHWDFMYERYISLPMDF